MAVSNNATLCYAKSNALQPSLWDEQVEMHKLAFPWADGDTSEFAAQQMLKFVAGNKHHCIGWEYIQGQLVTWYANVIEAWIENGVVWGTCIVTPEGPYVHGVQVEDDDLTV